MERRLSASLNLSEPGVEHNHVIYRKQVDGGGAGSPECLFSSSTQSDVGASLLPGMRAFVPAQPSHKPLEKHPNPELLGENLKTHHIRRATLEYTENHDLESNNKTITGISRHGL
jgi:hypothetical protein